MSHTKALMFPPYHFPASRLTWLYRLVPTVEAVAIWVVFVTFLSEIDSGRPSGWTEALTLVLGVFLALIGVIYRDMLRRMKATEEELAQHRREFEAFQQSTAQAALQAQRASEQQHRQNLVKLEKIAQSQFRAFAFLMSTAKDDPQLNDKVIRLLNIMREQNLDE